MKTTFLDINTLAAAALAMLRDPEDEAAYAHAVQLLGMIADKALAGVEAAEPAPLPV